MTTATKAEILCPACRVVCTGWPIVTCPACSWPFTDAFLKEIEGKPMLPVVKLTPPKEKPMHHPSIQNVLQFFSYEHLKGELRSTSAEFHGLAHHLADNIPPNPELTVALRKLLEAKDAAVRARLWKDPADA